MFQTEWTRTILSGLGRDAFGVFLEQLLKAAYDERNISVIRRADEYGPLQCFTRRLRLGGYPLGMGEMWGIYILDHLPFQLLSRANYDAIRSPDFRETAACLRRHHKSAIVFILNNTLLLDPAELQSSVLPIYDDLLAEAGLQCADLQVGNADSIANNSRTGRHLAEFLQAYQDGLTIELTEDGPRARAFLAQTYLDRAAAAPTGPLEPLVVRTSTRIQRVAAELTRVLVHTPNEETLREFFEAHYRECFGFHYDRVVAQVWSRLPNDPASDTTPTLFLRDAVLGNWNLFMLTPPATHLMGDRRDIPTLSKAVHDAIHQLENYRRLLTREEVRHQLRKRGIDSFEPTLHLVIGRRPTMRFEEWRWLRNAQATNITISTYDDIVDMMKQRSLSNVWSDAAFTLDSLETRGTGTSAASCAGSAPPKDSVSNAFVPTEQVCVMEQEPTFDYDVVLSFAGEDRLCAEKLAERLTQLNVKVFYDRYEQASLWGKDLYVHLSEVYNTKARYCVMILSKHYADKLWTNHERQAAQERAFRERHEYILPLRLDDSQIPGILATTGYLDLRTMQLDDVVRSLLEKLGRPSEGF